MIEVNEVQDVRILKWAQNRIREDLKLDTYFDPNSCYTMAFHDNKSLLGVVVMYNFMPPATVEMAIVTDSPKWCTKKILKRGFQYCFNELKVKRVYVQAKSNNTEALDMNERLGFTKMAILPDQIVTVDGEVCDNHIFSMTKDECKWL